VNPDCIRPLTADDRGVLEVIRRKLEHPERDVLMDQIPHLCVKPDSIAPWTYLPASEGARPARGVPEPIDVDATAVDERGELIGGIVLWLTDGFISDIEYFWYPDERPEVFPEPQQIAFVPTNR
jgi:hypothetical protein